MKIEKCVCGRMPRARSNCNDRWWVDCSVNCWCGPVCDSKDEAVEAWNAVMAGRQGEELMAIDLAEAQTYIKALEDWADNPVTSTNPEGDYATFLSRRPGRAR